VEFAERSSTAAVAALLASSALFASSALLNVPFLG